MLKCHYELRVTPCFSDPFPVKKESKVNTTKRDKVTEKKKALKMYLTLYLKKITTHFKVSRDFYYIKTTYCYKKITTLFLI